MTYQICTYDLYVYVNLWDMKISQAKKDKGVLCCAYGCNNKPADKKGGLCHKHYARKLRTDKPIQVRYSQAKQKAKSRGLEFTISIEWFRKFCQRTGYLTVKGRRGQNATLDRRCNMHGYHEWNIQILTNRANASKGNRFKGDNFDCPF